MVSTGGIFPSLVLTRFLHANRVPPPDQVRGHASLENASAGRNIMRITLVGSRHFGVATLKMLREHGIDVARVVVADGEDRLAAAGRAAGIDVVVQANPKLVVASEIAPHTD